MAFNAIPPVSFYPLLSDQKALRKPPEKHGELRRVNTRAALFYWHPKEPGSSRRDVDLYRARRCRGGLVSRDGCRLRTISIAFNPSGREHRLLAPASSPNRACRHQTVKVHGWPRDLPDIARLNDACLPDMDRRALKLAGA